MNLICVREYNIFCANDVVNSRLAMQMKYILLSLSFFNLSIISQDVSHNLSLF